MTKAYATILHTILPAAVLLLAFQAYANAGGDSRSHANSDPAPQAYTGSTIAPADTTDSDAIPEGYELIDTVMYVPAVAVDSTLVGHNIFDELSARGRRGSGTVRVSQSDEILAAMDTHFVRNASKSLTGYRVRIFFDNKQSSRRDSEATVNRFKEVHPEVPVYWSYVNPYFKVTVGDYRTRSEAMQLLRRLKEAFPAAFIVREAISYPAIDKEHAMVMDTVQILRPVPGGESEETVGPAVSL